MENTCDFVGAESAQAERDLTVQDLEQIAGGMMDLLFQGGAEYAKYRTGRLLGLK